jgi:hypothetical protein
LLALEELEEVESVVGVLLPEGVPLLVEGL